MAENLIKSSLLAFLRRFYNPELSYIDNVLKEWVNSFVTFFIDILFDGFIIYLVLSGLIFVFPKIDFIFLGNRYWQIPIVVIYLGLIQWFFTIFYRFIRVGYKTGGRK